MMHIFCFSDGQVFSGLEKHAICRAVHAYAQVHMKDAERWQLAQCPVRRHILGSAAIPARVSRAPAIRPFVESSWQFRPQRVSGFSGMRVFGSLAAKKQNNKYIPYYATDKVHSGVRKT